MRYIDVEWKHDFKDEPTRLVSEIGADDYEKRKLEFYPDGSVGYAFESTESLNTRLGTDVVPPLEEINSQQEFRGKTISKTKFELLWQEYVPSSS
ncbi:hypothetical protein AN214_01712 [Pseudoalteromonas sp. P1-9]|uniref:DUF6881 domain-containing protein n=1 Tax=Pseudoalteromonas sp. P1-9 TaxID=1710354 RepID=UPI0006D6212E|nr:hypothetical protein [Pseudoalteromonas sp. P1-9]KPV96366.1 hypothetical protein AN214_01712 [Pseudoalteromonas sp. P1-9]